MVQMRMMRIAKRLLASRNYAIYSGVFLEDPKKLLRWFRRNVCPLLDRKYAHHMTTAFRPDDDEMLTFPVGKMVRLKVVGYASNSKAQVVVVKGFRSGNVRPHITVATKSGVSPVYSNDLLRRGYKKVDGPILVGTAAWFGDDGKVHFDFSDSVYE